MGNKPKARIGGPASQAIRNIATQLLALSEGDDLKLIHLQLGCGALNDCADQVERLEGMAVPEARRVQAADIESGKVLPFDAAERLAVGGAITAPPRRRTLRRALRTRGLWGRFQTFMRRL